MQKSLTQMGGELPPAAFDLKATMQSFRRLARYLHGASEFDVERIRFPSGGGISFEIPTGQPDEPEVVREITGIILKYSFTNVYWDKEFGDGDGSPACYSEDGISGWDTDGNETPCAVCPRNRYFSKPDGRGKACSNMVSLYILREGEALPLMLRIPPMSVANFRSFLTRQIIPRDLEVFQVLTRIALTKATNKGGAPYAQAQFQAIGMLDENEIGMLRKEISPLLKLSGPELTQEEFTQEEG